MALSIRNWNLIILVVVLFLTLQSPLALAQSGQAGLRFDAISSTDEPVSGLMVNLASATYNGTAEFFNYTDDEGSAEIQLQPGEYFLSLHFQDTEVPHDLVDLQPDDILTEDWNIVIYGDEDLSVTLKLDEDFYKDTDGDGFPDWWEEANGLDPNVKEGDGSFFTDDGPLGSSPIHSPCCGRCHSYSHLGLYQDPAGQDPRAHHQGIHLQLHQGPTRHPPSRHKE